MPAFRRAVDTQFKRLGISAVLDPDGAALDVLVLPSQPDEMVRMGSMQILDETGVFEIRIADFTGYGNGTLLNLSGVLRKVQSHRVADRRRLKTRLDTIEVAAP
ncbi:hypothetical protein GGR95_002959 [Sulfitobacter undariae]|uniref:Uncharacterized protein n=1 Tax=Sulfitobacter undariae TaxID=1563671 RepID=A0A7W6E6V6_9RHOB|nr:hypothetical protein [Sulfitobacter undariae]MBB3995304.1 hypothetical protein [Sulfitobacter undariae]